MRSPATCFGTCLPIPASVVLASFGWGMIPGLLLIEAAVCGCAPCVVVLLPWCDASPWWWKLARNVDLDLVIALLMSCRVLTPEYWNSVNSVSFSFTPFASNGSGIKLYEWGLGSAPGTDNIFQFTLANATSAVSLRTSKS